MVIHCKRDGKSSWKEAKGECQQREAAIIADSLSALTRSKALHTAIAYADVVDPVEKMFTIKEL